jgi:hypothetical protein
VENISVPSAVANFKGLVSNVTSSLITAVNEPVVDPESTTLASPNVLSNVIELEVHVSEEPPTPIEPVIIGSAFAHGVIARTVAIASKVNANFFIIPP